MAIPETFVTPVLAVAEFAGASGRDFITGVVLAYEVYLRLSNVFHNRGFDHTNFCCLGTAIAAGKLLRLSSGQLAHCISMAAVPNVILRQVRTEPLSMWKAVCHRTCGKGGSVFRYIGAGGYGGSEYAFRGQAELV